MSFFSLLSKQMLQGLPVLHVYCVTRSWQKHFKLTYSWKICFWYTTLWYVNSKHRLHDSHSIVPTRELFSIFRLNTETILKHPSYCLKVQTRAGTRPFIRHRELFQIANKQIMRYAIFLSNFTESKDTAICNVYFDFLSYFLSNEICTLSRSNS